MTTITCTYCRAVFPHVTAIVEHVEARHPRMYRRGMVRLLCAVATADLMDEAS